MKQIVVCHKEGWREGRDVSLLSAFRKRLRARKKKGTPVFIWVGAAVPRQPCQGRSQAARPAAHGAAARTSIPLQEHGETAVSQHTVWPYLFQVALEQARRCWVPRSSKAACSLLPRSLRLGELMNFNLRRVLMVKCVFACGSYRHTILFTHIHTQLEQQQQCEQFPPSAVQKRNLKKKRRENQSLGSTPLPARKQTFNQLNSDVINCG